MNLQLIPNQIFVEDQQAMEDDGIILPMKPPLPHPIRHHLPNKPHSSMQSSILNSFTNTVGHSTAIADATNKFGDLSRRPSVIGIAPMHVEKPAPTSLDLMSSFPVRYYI